MATVSLAGKSVADLEGAGFDSPKPRAGAILDAILAAKDSGGRTYRNMILVLDDFDRVLNAQDPASKATLAYMLFLLDPANGHRFFSPYFAAEVQLPDFFIVTGNSVISDMALRRRFSNVELKASKLSTRPHLYHAHLNASFLKIERQDQSRCHQGAE